MAHSQLDVIERLIELSRNGRSIVPLLGAGISIEAGIPSLGELTRYLAKVQLYVRERIYRPSEDRNEPPSETKDPSEYLRDFGWPDPNQLDSDLWMWLQEEEAAKRGYGRDPQVWMDRLVQDELITYFERLDQGFADGLRSLQHCISRVEEEAARRTVPEASSSADPCGALVERWQALHRENPGQVEVPSLLASSHWDLRGDYWKGLLSHLTRSNPDYVDTLFQQLVQRHRPGTAHRYLAFLTGVFRLRVFMTTNFDSLLEDSLRMEGVQPAVYEALEGYPLPHPSLVHNEVSVIKLHGGAFGLRVGEQLNRPLDEESRARLKAYLPANPVLLVMGLGGWDLRVLDTVELAREKDGDVFWLRFEGRAPQPVQDRFYVESEDGDEPSAPDWFRESRVHDPGAFLKELFSRRTGAHPASSNPYRAYDQRPIPEEGDGPAPSRDRVPENAPIRIFVDRADDSPVESGSRRLAEFVARKAESHSPVWIDLESKATVDDLVVDIMLQLRRYDSSLPPEVLTVERAVEPGGSAESREKVIRRIFNALRRGRYVLAFDGVGSFGRPPLQHHGLSVEDEHAARKRARQGSDFLEQLVRAAHGREKPVDGSARPSPLDLGHSILAFSVDLQVFRTSSEAESPELWKRLKKLRDSDPGRSLLLPSDLTPDPKRGTSLTRESLGGSGGKLYWDGCTVLCAFRRRRSLVALHRLLPKYLHLTDPGARQQGDSGAEATFPGSGPGSSDAGSTQVRAGIDRFLAWCIDRQELMIRVEGGYYSIARRVRDEIYNAAQDRTRSRSLLDDLEKLAAPPEGFPSNVHAERLDQLATLAAIHGDIASYYQELYTASREVPALLEHFYHRISSLRYLTKLDRWAPVVESIDLRELPGTGRGEESLAARLCRFFSPREHPDVGETESPGGRPVTDGGHLDRIFLRLRRWQTVRALRGTLWRQRERLLGGVPSLTLLHWAEAVLAQARRFRVDTALEPGANPFVPLDRQTSDPAKGLVFRSPDETELEGAIVGILRDLRKEVNQLEAEVHKDRLDAGGVVRACGSWFEHTLRKELDAAEPPRRQSALGYRWIFKPKAWTSFPGESDSLEEPPLLELQENLFRIATALRKAGRPGLSGKLIDFMKHLARATWTSTDHRADAEYARVYCLLHEADHMLNPLNPWVSKGRGEELFQQQQSGGLAAVQLCGEALERLGWVQEKNRTMRSYLHSLKGRAHYLSLDFMAAYREFDLAHAALSGTKGRGAWEERAETHAVAYMRHAETLMLRADDKLIEWCFLARYPRSHPEGAASSKQRRSLSTWDIEDLEGLDDQVRKRNAARHLARRMGKNLEPRHQDTFADTIVGARQRLSSASDLLDLAEEHLDEARRDLEWRAWLAQLRAQLHVELLLLQITGGLPVEIEAATSSSADRSRESAGRIRRSREIGTLVNDLRQGLRAIRQGLDIILPDINNRKKGKLMRDPRLLHFLRLWRELMVCGAYLTRMIGAANPNDLEVTRLWERWKTLNALEGLVRLPKSTEGERWLERHDEDFPRCEQTGPGRFDEERGAPEACLPGLASRGRALLLINECMNRKLTEDLVSHLLPPLHRKTPSVERRPSES